MMNTFKGNVLIGCLAGIVALIYGGLQIYAGFKGIELKLGIGWATAAIFAACLLRFTLPVTIGAYFGAMLLWGWPWYWALMFAAPGLLFMLLMIPGVLATLVQTLRNR